MPRSPMPTSPLSWTSLVGLGLRARVGVRARKLNDEAWWARNTARLQGEQLRWLLRRASGTEIGRELGFARLAAIDDHAERWRAYRSAVPVSDWYAFQDRIARMREGGERDVLWPGLVTRFAQTSGTTAGDKFIPVSDEMMRSNYLASLDIFAHLMRRGVSLERVMGGRCLFLGGSSDLEYNEHGVATGDLSGLVTPMIRWPLSAIYSPGPEVALMSDWTEKIDAMARVALEQDVRFISGMPSWAGVLIERVLELAGERGDPNSCAKDVWPNLSVFVHGGVRYDPFEPRLSRLAFGDPATDFPHRVELYPASEGFVAIQDRQNEPGMRLLTDIRNALEFVPIERIDDDEPEAFGAHEVEPGQRYVVVLTTCAGMWRYVLGDVVEFDTIPGGFGGGGGSGGSEGGAGPARVRIVGRHRHFINAFGENLIVEHIERGVAAASGELGLAVGEFTAAPVYPEEGGRRAGLELAVEFEAGPDPATLGAFRDAFDRAVQAENVDYTTKRRDDLGMAPPTVRALPMGAFHRWLESKGKLGGQHKCPRCANHREILEGVLGETAELSGK